MNSFSIQQYQYEYEHQSVMDSYKQWLARDLYANVFTDKVDAPVFLQKLSFFQAEGIRHDIACHAAVTHSSIQNASKQVGQKIQSAVALISSSLDDGFSLMNNRMLEVNSNLGLIGQGVNAVNETMQQGNKILSDIDKGIARTNFGISQINRGIGAMAAGMNTMNKNMMTGFNTLNQNMNAMNKNMMSGFDALEAGMYVLSSNIAQAASVIRFSLRQMHGTLKLILDELRIPESQRERRYHIEEGMKYFSKGMKSGDCLYFEDALEEFSKATSIERKDFFSWYYIGMIHLYSKEHLDIDKAFSAFDRYLHYADALVERHNLFDEALMMKAECCYLKQDSDYAYKLIEELIPVNDKAALRAMKYLSVSAGTKKQAVEILRQLMKKNPYIVMQVLEDYDILSNDNITSFLKEYKENTKKEIVEQLSILDREKLSLKKYPLSYYEDTFKEVESLKSQVNRKVTNIGVVDAIALKEKIIVVSQKIREMSKTESFEKFKYSPENFIDKGDYIELKVSIGNIRMIEKVCSPNKMNWNDAMQYAKNLRKGGFRDWHVPTKEELLEIYKIKDICWINENDGLFWSSSVWSGYSDFACYVFFYDGNVNNVNVGHNYYVRCVR